MLSDVDIIKYMRRKDIIIVEPIFIDNKIVYKDVINCKTGQEVSSGTLDCHGYNIRVNSYSRFGFHDDFIELKSGEVLYIQPDEFILLRSYEKIKLSNKIGATVHSLARNVLLGMNHISTTIQPGFAIHEEQAQSLTFAIHNFSRVPIEIRKRDFICRIIFHKVTPAKKLAPLSELVEQRSDEAKEKLKSKYENKSKLKGWFFFSLLFLFMALFYYISTDIFSLDVRAAIAFTSFILGNFINYLRSKYKILNWSIRKNLIQFLDK